MTVEHFHGQSPTTSLPRAEQRELRLRITASEDVCAVPGTQRISMLRWQRRAVVEGIAADPRDRVRDRHRRQRPAAVEGSVTDLRDRVRDRHRRQ